MHAYGEVGEWGSRWTGSARFRPRWPWSGLRSQVAKGVQGTALSMLTSISPSGNDGCLFYFVEKMNKLRLFQ